MTRRDLIQAMEESRAGLLEAIEGLSDEALLEAGVAGDWSVRDVLQHLSLWEAELVMLLAGYRRGRRPSSERFRKSIDELNAAWHESTLQRPLEHVIADFHAVRRQILRQLEAIPDEEFSRPPRFAWLNGRPLEEWVGEDTYRHEAEHTAEIRRWRARPRAPEAG